MNTRVTFGVIHTGNIWCETHFLPLGSKQTLRITASKTGFVLEMEVVALFRVWFIDGWKKDKSSYCRVNWWNFYELLSQVMPQIHLASKRMPWFQKNMQKGIWLNSVLGMRNDDNRTVSLVDTNPSDLQAVLLPLWTMLRRWDDKERVRRRIGKERCPGVCHTSLEQNNMM